MTRYRALFWVAAIAAVVAIVVLSWIPAEMEVRTGLRGQYEHVIAYAGMAFVWKLGWPERRSRSMALGFTLLAAVLEIGQLWVPGRTSQFIDFAASTAGAVAGLSIAHVLQHCFRAG